MASKNQNISPESSVILQNKDRSRAAILDLSRVVDANEPVIQRIVNTELHTVTGGADDALGINTYRVGRYGWLLIGNMKSLPALLTATDRISQVFAEAHQGKVDVHWFDLPREAKPLAACLRILADDRPITSPSPLTEDVIGFLRVERALHNADLSSLIRHHPIHRVEEGGALVPVMLEQTVDLTALEKMFNVTILASPWMLARVTELLDRRMLRHLLHEQTPPRLPIAVKLHTGTMRHTDFATLLDELPAHWHGNLVIELPYAEWHAAPDAVKEALAIGRKRQCVIALDNVPVDHSAEPPLPDDILLRFTTAAAPTGTSRKTPALHPHATARGAELKALIHNLGADRCILTHCDSLALVRQGLDAGFRLLQGPAVSDFVEMRNELSPAPTTTAEAKAAPEEEDGPAGEANAGAAAPASFMTRAFRWLGLGSPLDKDAVHTKTGG
ncbi:hypothetical protein [Nitrospirillum iridis]|uniref:EAL domain-containing protein n=1 Tax=Nitrospirillum iridis TaxID=765888 RepID=A0A7X0AWM1_9PROT|nr:hypothetical protein [Nitrospirillum iridis]MBB6250029.1 hypothetical protein [Nitrospirillum iridis]